jgi:divinyl protochlorophyllide a 8-vinyl-reductase
MLSAGLTFESAHAARSQAGLVGPNAVIQLAAALSAEPGDAERVFARAGFSRLLRKLPDAMVDETIPARLFDALWRELPAAQAARIAHDAGRRTGTYVLENRIPKLARVLLRLLPVRIAAPLLLKAIERNAWTFAGSGLCRVKAGEPPVITIAGNPIAMPGCVWHVGVFEVLFRSLVSEHVQIRHSENTMDGVPVSRFEIRLRC